MKEAILLTDGYKLDHRRQYPEGTEYVYSNWTPRSCHYYPETEEGAVVFGIQYFIKEYLMKQFQEGFFNKPKDVAVAEFKRRVDTFLGPNNVGTRHIEELHDLGYLPIRIKALPEGTLCPIRVPALTFINTHPDFFWLTNYFETLISTTLWLPMTSATTARLYKKELIRHARKTGFKDVDLNFLIHDFSMRGMAGVEAAIMSGMGHMTSFCGSETIPAIAGLEEYYNANAEKELIAATIPATEHSVMCAGGKEDELETFRRLITEVYSTGFVSIVSDTWDFWKVMTEYLPKLKDEILARDGRLVIRPDSGDPVHIIAGYKHEDY
jgi:nicotinamide phosphoribosyltransferase